MNTELIIKNEPKSRLAESIKTIRTNLMFSNLEDNLKIILVTSPNPGDGKSFIAANLALSFAEENKKTLLIDCDLRKGRQHNIFNIENSSKKGYSNLILNYRATTKFKTYTCDTEYENLRVLTTGPLPPNPVEMLNSKNNKELLENLKKYYDIIILDCPPVLGLADAMVLTQYSDANILTIGLNKTTQDEIDKVKKEFAKANASITGVVANKDKVKGKSYYNYGYYYGDSKEHE